MVTLSFNDKNAKLQISYFEVSETGFPNR